MNNNKILVFFRCFPMFFHPFPAINGGFHTPQQPSDALPSSPADISPEASLSKSWKTPRKRSNSATRKPPSAGEGHHWDFNHPQLVVTPKNGVKVGWDDWESHKIHVPNHQPAKYWSCLFLLAFPPKKMLKGEK